MKYLILTVILALVFFASVDEAIACTCTPVSINKHIEQSKSIFSGKVLEIIQHKDGTFRRGALEAKVKVQNVWKGDVSGVVSVTTLPSLCGFPFRKNERLLIFATKNLFTTSCSGTDSLKSSKKIIKTLGKPIFTKQTK